MNHFVFVRRVGYFSHVLRVLRFRSLRELSAYRRGFYYVANRRLGILCDQPVNDHEFPELDLFNLGREDANAGEETIVLTENETIMEPLNHVRKQWAKVPGMDGITIDDVLGVIHRATTDAEWESEFNEVFGHLVSMNSTQASLREARVRLVRILCRYLRAERANAIHQRGQS